MKHHYVWVATVFSLFSHGCFGGSEKRILAVGGTHVFEGQASCSLVRTEPEGSVKDLNWNDALALEARSEGIAEVVCSTERFRLEIVAPTRLVIEIVNGGTEADIRVGERFKVQARFYDRRERELEVGKLTEFDWAFSEVLEVANDRSSGEFGLCDTCFGMYGFRAVKSGRGWIEARLGKLRRILTVVAGP